MPETRDDLCWSVLQRAPNACVAWYLMAAWAYYHRDTPLLTDETFDRMGQIMAENWPRIAHPHKHLIGLDDLLAGSLYRLPEAAYPAVCRGAATRLLEGSE